MPRRKTPRKSEANLAASICGAFLIILVLCLFTFRLGCAFGLFGYADPDTCWILDAGRQIVELGYVPRLDSYSYTLPMLAAQGNPQLFVMHQWLFDLINYLMFRYLDLFGPMLFCCLVTTFAYVIIPLMSGLKDKTPRLWLFFVVVLCVDEGATRAFVRPEGVTALMIALWLYWLHGLRRKYDADDSTKLRFFPIAFAATMWLWCNMHGGFVTGFYLLGAYAVFSLLA
ncbi:MAG: hypothetical protein ACRD3W_04150, partial [Terriglobales bacterium]